MLKHLKLSLLILLLTSCQGQINYAAERAAYHASRELETLIDKKLNVGPGVDMPDVPGWEDDLVYWVGGLIAAAVGLGGRRYLQKRRSQNGN